MKRLFRSTGRASNDQRLTTAELLRRRKTAGLRALLTVGAFWGVAGVAGFAYFRGVPPEIEGWLVFVVLSAAAVYAFSTVQYDHRLLNHRQQATLAYEKLVDAEDTELEDRLAEASQRLQDTSRELAELQVMAAHRAEEVENLHRSAVEARQQAERDREHADVVRAYLDVNSDELDQRQRRMNWRFVLIGAGVASSLAS
ncbi:hypothetical protein [Nonomuraea recticatena]|uniref:hypothetical protein n=1 Tax=Nonomuraea recticatena TaxID=46178 RepID=UPI00361FA81A